MLTALMLSLVLAASPGDSPSGPNATGSGSNESLDTLTENDGIKPAAPADSLPVFALKGIVVTATRTALAQLAAPASVSIIVPDPGDPGQGAIAAFSQVPGTNSGLYGGLGSMANFSIRGSSAEQVLFLLNGMPLNSALNGGYDLKKLNANIKQIEIVRGPASALYGANALAGVVNIITADDAPEKPYSRITYQYGKHKQQSMSAVLSRQLNRFTGITFSADWKSTDGERPNSDYSGSNYLLGLKIRPDSLIRIGMEYQSYQSIGGSPGSISWQTANDRMSDDQQDYYASLEYSDLVKFKIGQSQISTFYYYEYNNTAPENFSRQSNADIQFTYGFWQGFNTVWGGAYQQIKSESDNSGSHRTNLYSAFVNQEYRPWHPWLIVAGLRYDKNYGHDAQTSPNISSSWQFNDRWTIYGNYGQAYRVPTINELYWNEPYTTGNPDLVPEKSQQYELGTRYKEDSYNISFSAYQRKTNDMIRWLYDMNTYLLTWANNLDVNTSGVELTGGISILKYLVFDLNYGLCVAKVTSDSSRELNYTPANSASLALSFRDFPVTDRLSLSWQFNTQYKDRQMVSPPDELGPGFELPRYFVSGQTLSLKIRDAVLFYKIDNLFNAEYQVRAGYPMPRRSYALGISLELWD
ncbi:MAG: TonB-dependent receptor [Candidatus Edwardsbacteria bacterium]|nr:TonB-dependent receptor [Candidatus Edwardsbacteria bacterium]